MEQIKLKLVYNTDFEKLYLDIKNYIVDKSNIQLEAYHEEFKNDKKKAFTLKGSWSSKQTPFLLIECEKPIKAFYSEANECIIDNIIKYLSKYE